MLPENNSTRLWTGKNITTSAEVMRIEQRFFSGRFDIKSVTLPSDYPSSNGEEEGDSFMLPKNRSRIFRIIPDKVRSIEQSFFSECFDIKSVTLPSVYLSSNLISDNRAAVRKLPY